jgi:hypothetical protein
MEFILLLVGDEEAEAQLDEAAAGALIEAHGRFTDELRAAGAHRWGVGLQPSSTATTVDVAGDGAVTDGPFAETAEHIGGIYVIDVADVDEAIAWARRVPASPGLRVEIRPGLGQ